MLTQLREIVDKVVSAHTLIDALDQLVSNTTQVMKTDCCSVYIADHQRQVYTLMATQGLNKSRRRISLRFDQGLVGLVGQRAEPLNIADARLHPRFKHLPGIGEESFRSFLVLRLYISAKCSALLWFSSVSNVNLLRVKNLFSHACGPVSGYFSAR